MAKTRTESIYFFSEKELGMVADELAQLQKSIEAVRPMLKKTHLVAFKSHAAGALLRGFGEYNSFLKDAKVAIGDAQEMQFNAVPTRKTREYIWEDGWTPGVYSLPEVKERDAEFYPGRLNLPSKTPGK